MYRYRGLQRFLLGCTAFCVLAFSGSALATTGNVAYKTTHMFSVGSAGTGDGQFNVMSQIQLVGDRLYVVEESNNRVQVFDALTGAFITKFGSSGSSDGQFEIPRGMVYNAETGYLYVGDILTHRIQMFDPDNGNVYVNQFGGGADFSRPAHMATDAAGNMYIADMSNNRIRVVDKNHNIIGTFGGIGYMSDPYGVAVDSTGKIYVSTYNSGTDFYRILVFDENYNYLTTIAQEGHDYGEVWMPTGMAVDRFDNLYVADSGNNRILVFDSNGVLIDVVTNTPSLAAMNFPTSIAVTDDGRFYIADRDNNMIHMYEKSIEEIFFDDSPMTGDEFALTTGPVAIASLQGPAGNVKSFSHDFIDYWGLDVREHWALSGDSSFFSNIRVRTNAALQNDGTLRAPDIAFNAGSVVTGAGRFVGDTVMQATLAPGSVTGNGLENGIATLEFDGDYSDSAAATYAIEVNDAGQSDHVAITGAATLSGGTLDILAQNGNYALSTSYVILSAAGGINGTFGTITSNLAFLVPQLDYSNPNQITLVLNNTTPQHTFDDFAQTPNQHALAGPLQNFLDAGMAGDSDAVAKLQALSTDEATALLQQLVPEEVASLPLIHRHIVHGMRAPVAMRLAASGFGAAAPRDTVPSFALLSPAMHNSKAAPVALSKAQFWMQALGGAANHQGSAGVNGYRLGLVGMRAGADAMLTPDLFAGLSFGYSNSTTDYRRSPDKGQQDYYHADFYGQMRLGDFVLDGIAGFGAGKSDITRYLSAGGLGRTARGDVHLYDANARLKLGRPFRMENAIQVTPSLQASAGWYHQGSYRESGAGALNLSLESESTVPVSISPAVHLEKIFTAHDGSVAIVPKFGMGVVWQLNERDQSVRGHFANGASAGSFMTDGVRQRPLSLSLEGGITVAPFRGGAVPLLHIGAAGMVNDLASEFTADISLKWQL